MAIFIYGLVCPVAGVVRYVGKTNDLESRLAGHIAAANKFKHYTARWISSIKRAGYLPSIRVLATLDDGDDWESVERHYIANGKALGWRLTNTTPGGEGGGFIRPEDKAVWRERVTASLRTPETRKKISEGVIKANTRPEMKAKQRQRWVDMWTDSSYRERMLIVAREFNNRPEVKARKRVISKEKMAAPGARALVSDKLKAYYATEEGRQSKINTSRETVKRAKSVEGQKRLWADPEYRAKHIVALKAAAASPEGQERLRLAWVKRKAAKAAVQQE